MVAAIDRETVIPMILAEVATGRALDRVLREDDGMPSASTFWRWHMEDSNLRDNLARARENGVEAHMDEAMSIADTPLLGEETEVDADGNVVKIKRGDMLGHRKLQIETRLKRAQMIAPRKYGPKMGVEHSGSIDWSSAVTEGNSRADQR